MDFAPATRWLRRILNSLNRIAQRVSGLPTFRRERGED
jgi:hypothetical protein